MSAVILMIHIIEN